MIAFVLGAGLGTRLQPLTEWLPKPMIPVYHRPLITYAFDHVVNAGAEALVVNTHHCAEAYADTFPTNSYHGTPLTFRHEPILLETAGGIANVADLLGDDRFLVYNGDILSDVDLQPLLETHQRDGNEVTLLVRSEGPGLHIGLKHGSRAVRDIHNMVGNEIDQGYQFTGIYVVEPSFLKRLTPGKKESVIPIFLDMIRKGGGLGVCLGDDGVWWDLGDVEIYRKVHAWIRDSEFPKYGESGPWECRSAGADIEDGATIDELTIVGPRARVEAGATLSDCIVWPGAQVTSDQSEHQAIIRASNEIKHHCFSTFT